MKYTSYLHAYEDGTECSETSAYKIQTPGNYSEERIQHLEPLLPTKCKGDIFLQLKQLECLIMGWELLLGIY